MACKFHALMSRLPLPPSRRLLAQALVPLLGLLLCAPAPASAERADRAKPLNVEADQPGKIDLQNQFVVFNGNVVVTKGTMVIRAARIEVRETPEGYQTAVAIAAAGKLASFRQKRDGVDEFIEGEAERLEYDGKTDTIKFINKASVRRLRGTTPADEIAGNLVTYDSAAEVFNVSGGAAPSASSPGGRVRVVLTPRETVPAEAASKPKAGASEGARP